MESPGASVIFSKGIVVQSHPVSTLVIFTVSVPTEWNQKYCVTVEC